MRAEDGRTCWGKRYFISKYSRWGNCAAKGQYDFRKKRDNSPQLEKLRKDTEKRPLLIELRAGSGNAGHMGPDCDSSLCPNIRDSLLKHD